MRRDGVPIRRRNLISGLAAAVAVSGLTVVAVAQAEPSTDPTPSPAPAATAPAQTSTTTAAAAPTPAGVTTSGGASNPKAANSNAAGSTAAAASGDVLDQLAEEYAVGSGGGQLSNLLKTSLKLRSMGFKPTKQYYDEIQEAMQHRPNQNPLISALKDTIAYQQKIRAQMEILQQSQAQQNPNSAVMGAGQMPADSNPNQLGVSAPQGAPVSVAAVPVAPAAPAPPVIMPAETP